MDRVIPTLLLTTAMVMLCPACGPRGPAHEGDLRHLVVISLDTTRADSFGCYGREDARTPAVDALAQAGVRFSDVTAAAPTTLAAHTSLLTGSWVHTHGVLRNGFTIHPDNVMLAELLSAAGFHTAAVLGSFALEERFGFAQGFDHFDQEFDLLVMPQGNDQNQRRCDRVTEAALLHLDQAAAELERLFLFVHYFDPHAPYAPPEKWSALHSKDGRPQSSSMGDVDASVRAHQDAAIGQSFGHAGTINNGFRGPLRPLVGAVSGVPNATDLRLAELYAGEVSFVDSAIARLMDGLAERGLLQETLVVLVADHGETFWEHEDLWNHGLAVYQTSVHVPWIMRFPDGRHAGRVVEEPVSTIDLLPTLCELLELPLPERAEGVSVLEAIEGRPFRRGAVFCEATQPWVVERRGEWGNAAKPRCVRKGRWKYTFSAYSEVEQLFDLATDPGERTNLLEGPPAKEVMALRNELRAELMRWHAGRAPLPSTFDSTQVRETLERLKAMGYSGVQEDD